MSRTCVKSPPPPYGPFVSRDALPADILGVPAVARAGRDAQAHLVGFAVCGGGGRAMKRIEADEIDAQLIEIEAALGEPGAHDLRASLARAAAFGPAYPTCPSPICPAAWQTVTLSVSVRGSPRAPETAITSGPVCAKESPVKSATQSGVT